MFLTGVSCNNVSKLNPESQERPDPMTRFIQQDKRAAQAQIADYKAIPEMIGYLSPQESGIKDSYENILKQNAFFAPAIPAEGPKRLQWEQGMTWQKADSIYTAFVNKNYGNRFINGFRDLGAYEILVRLGLLTDNSPLSDQKINYYLHELVKSKSMNTPLIEACMKRLEGSKYQEQLNQVAEQVIKNVDNSERFKKLQNFVQNPPPNNLKTGNPAFDSIRMADAKESVRRAQVTYAGLLSAKQKIEQYNSVK